MAKNRYKITVGLIFLLGVGLALLVLTAPSLTSKVVLNLKIEPGDTVTAASFLRGPDTAASFVGDAPDVTKLGSQTVTLKVGRVNYTSTLEVKDTVPPTGTPVDRAFFVGGAADPAAFVKDIQDQTPVTVTFAAKPDMTKAGTQQVTLVLTDSGGNQTDLKTKMTLVKLRDNVSIAIDSGTLPEAADFLEDPNDLGGFSCTADLSAADASKGGAVPVPVTVDGHTADSRLTFIDTTAPVGNPVNQTVYCGRVLDAKDFVKEIVDQSDVTVTYQTAPDFKALGTRQVTVVLTDAAGNASAVTASLTVLRDTVPPVITGPPVKYAVKGATVAYKQDLNITDNSGADLDIQVDASKVDINTAGTYPVKITATDPSGNSTSFNFKLNVSDDVTDDQVKPLADAVLAQIITPGMDDTAKIRAIYNWIQVHVRYTSDANKNSVNYGAYQALTQGNGDCYTFYAVSQYLLTDAGIENMMIKRVPTGIYSHWWNLVKVNGVWYHFDSCPNPADRFDPNAPKPDQCMMTDSRVKQLTAQRGDMYYVYDPSLYPAIAP